MKYSKHALGPTKTYSARELKIYCWAEASLLLYWTQKAGWPGVVDLQADDSLSPRLLTAPAGKHRVALFGGKVGREFEAEHSFCFLQQTRSPTCVHPWHAAGILPKRGNANSYSRRSATISKKEEATNCQKEHSAEATNCQKEHSRKLLVIREFQCGSRTPESTELCLERAEKGVRG